MIIGDLSPTLGEYFVMKDGDNTVYTMYDFKVDTLKSLSAIIKNSIVSTLILTILMTLKLSAVMKLLKSEY